ncbi:MAG: VOC family protein [Hyphococcus sp.]|nr:MAG: VOC family protein [Marinicaulis sp.]
MTLSTYLFFDGQCAEAFDFYKSVFGGEFTVIQTFADGPPEMGVPDAEKEKIMHVSLPVGEAVLMGSDTVSHQGEPPKPGNSFAISYSPPTKQDADIAFPKLADGGSVSMELQETFWGSYFGMCKDKFGVSWMVNVDIGQPK